MLSLLPARYSLVLIATTLTCLLLYLTFSPPSFWDQAVIYDNAAPHGNGTDHLHASQHLSTPIRDKRLAQVLNDTLGFQEIYLISLPTRTDKQDTFAMQAAFTSLRYTVMDGVDGSTVPSKALPHTMELGPNIVGCWRAHMNTLQRMVRDNVATALIFEDDADWDVSFKQQMVQFARGSRFITNTTHPEKSASPYGDNWDILWIGHCGTWYHEEDNRRIFVIPQDPTTEPLQLRQNVDQPDLSHWETGPHADPRTRIVFNSKGGVCTAGYAISQQGARKALFHMSMIPYNDPVDWGYVNLCNDKKMNMTCVSVFPQLVGVSRPTANASKYSDIGYGSDEDRVVEEAKSLHIVYSTRLNMEKLLMGDTVFDSQFPDITGPQMDIKDIGAAVGHAEILRVEDLPKPKVDEEIPT